MRTHRDNNDVFIYRDNLKANYEQGDYFLVIDMDDLRAFDNALKDLVWKRPKEYVGLFEEAAKKVLQGLVSGLRDSEV